MRILTLALAGALLAGAPQDNPWHRSLRDGKKAAARSGKPIFLLTIWAPKV